MFLCLCLCRSMRVSQGGGVCVPVFPSKSSLCSLFPFKYFTMFPCSHLKKSKVFTVFRHLRLLICLPAQPVTVNSREVRYFILQGYGWSSPINVKDGHNPPLAERPENYLLHWHYTHIFYLLNALGHDRIRILSQK